ncbi:MAG: hypothetical protein JNL11_14410 [Bdellovibrionaceae bacterium]|nr:hypothetical protein [Pseudobdellovibrionaceae bacterium]
MLKNNRGMAALEVVGIFAVIMILFNFSLGFYGVIQTGILKSMAARNYAFETYRFRSNLDFFWRNGSDTTGLSRYRLFGNRFHGVTSENSVASDHWAATARPISFVSSFGGMGEDGVDYSRTPGSDGNAQLHNKLVYEIRDDGKPLLDEKDKYKAFPVWIKSVYGICINAKCAPIK